MQDEGPGRGGTGDQDEGPGGTRDRGGDRGGEDQDEGPGTGGPGGTGTLEKLEEDIALVQGCYHCRRFPLHSTVSYDLNQGNMDTGGLVEESPGTNALDHSDG